MAEKKTFTGMQFIHGDLRERIVYDRNECPVFSYNPEEWQLDVVLIRRFTPGTYMKYKNGAPLKEWGNYAVVEAIEPHDLPGLISGYEWRRVTIEEAE